MNSPSSFFSLRLARRLPGIVLSGCKISAILPNALFSFKRPIPIESKLATLVSSRRTSSLIWRPLLSFSPLKSRITGARYSPNVIATFSLILPTFLPTAVLATLAVLFCPKSDRKASTFWAGRVFRSAPLAGIVAPRTPPATPPITPPLTYSPAVASGLFLPVWVIP